MGSVNKNILQSFSGCPEFHHQRFIRSQATETAYGHGNGNEEFELSPKAAHERDRAMDMNNSEMVEDIKKESSTRQWYTTVQQTHQWFQMMKYQRSHNTPTVQNHHKSKKISREKLTEKNRKITELEARLTANGIGQSDLEE